LQVLVAIVGEAGGTTNENIGVAAPLCAGGGWSMARVRVRVQGQEGMIEGRKWFGPFSFAVAGTVNS
jgi:hypothetical protein